jgi:hypothetical protein
MTAPDPNTDGTVRFKKIMNASNNTVDDKIRSRLPQGSGAGPTAPPPPVTTVVQTVQTRPTPRYVKFLQAFWTVASVMSITVNIVMLAIILILLKMLGGLQVTANDQVSGLLGGLYANFVKMDQATISTVIPVDSNVPLNLQVPVHLQGIQTQNTQIQLAENAVINRAHVKITEGGVQIDANAQVVLPAGTNLSINIQDLNLDFNVPIQQTIPVHLDVPVNIPLNQTQLHEPFVGLRQVVQPYYCLVEPNAIMNGVQVCSPVANP